MSVPSTVDPQKVPLPLDDPYFKPAVDCCRLRGPFFSARNITNLMLFALNDEEQAVLWTKRFLTTILKDPNRFKQCDESRCSRCRYYTLCAVNTLRPDCASFIPQSEKEYNIATKITQHDYCTFGSRTFTYYYGFIITPQAKPRQGSWEDFLVAVRGCFPKKMESLSVDITPALPADAPFIRFGIRPKRNETLDEYTTRTTALVAAGEAAMQKALENSTSPASPQQLETRLRLFINRLGHGSILANTYANDVLAMVEDWWPGTDPDTLRNEVENICPARDKGKYVWEVLREARVLHRKNKEVSLVSQ